MAVIEYKKGCKYVTSLGGGDVAVLTGGLGGPGAGTHCVIVDEARGTRVLRHHAVLAAHELVAHVGVRVPEEPVGPGASLRRLRLFYIKK